MVNDDTLSSDSWVAMKNLIVSALTTEGITASFEASYNDKPLRKPLVTLDPINVSEQSFYFNHSEGDKNLPFVISIYAKTSLLADTIKDAVIKHLKTDHISGLQFRGYDTDYAFNYDDKTPVHNVTIVANYSR